ncbi:MAG: c-type cytochrome [Nitrospirota bacterium]|nr:c-type cytochrome [Nitrospirota bacterium]
MRVRLAIARWALLLAFVSAPLAPVAALGAGSAKANPGSPGAGRAAFERLGCGACHRVTAPSGGMDVAARVAQKGPDLWFAGSKLQRPWLSGWLKNPTPLSGIRYDRLGPEPASGRHPATPAGDVAAVTAYLMSLTDPQMPAGVVDMGQPMSRTGRIWGNRLFGKEQQCFACHRTGTRFGDQVGGISAPTLVGAGKRLNPDWIHAWLTNPTRYVPVTRMPVYLQGAYSGYSPEQMGQLARYIAAMGLETGDGATPATDTTPPAVTPWPVSPVDGKNLSRVETNFQFLCAQCHGAKGNATGPNASKQLEVLPADLTDPVYMAKFTDDQIFRTLTFGGPVNNLSSLMPPWGNRLSDDERHELVRYIRAVLCKCKGGGG